MLPIIAAIGSFFTKNKYSTIVTVIALAFLGLFLFQRAQTRKERFRANVAEHNFNAATDSIRVVLDKAGKIEYDKLAFITDELENLKALNADLYAEIKNIKGRVSSIVKGDVRIIHDTVPLVVKGELIDSTVRADFDYSREFSPGNFRKLRGYTKYDLRNGISTGELLQDEVGFRFTTGIKNLDKGKPEIFLKSDHPGFRVDSLDGAVLDPNLFNKKKVPVLTVGVGVEWTPVTYDIRTKKTTVNGSQFGVSVGVNVNLVQLLKNK